LECQLSGYKPKDREKKTPKSLGPSLNPSTSKRFPKRRGIYTPSNLLVLIGKRQIEIEME